MPLVSKKKTVVEDELRSLSQVKVEILNHSLHVNVIGMMNVVNINYPKTLSLHLHIITRTKK